MIRKAVIFGIKSTYLNKKEKSLFAKNKPWGVILFSRNIKNISQLRKLVKSIKVIFKDKNYPILIDEEGGKVSRLKKIIDLSIFSQDYFNKIFLQDKKKLFTYYKTYINSVSNILNYVGININTAPVLDVRRISSHNIIGSRSFSKNPKIVSALGKLCIQLYKKNKIATVMKHIPGHGLSKKDTHFNTSIVKNSKNELIKNDFNPFKENKTFFAMTAHIIYEAYDKEKTATHSKIVIEQVIRKHIKFNGILISDDISMKSLESNIESNAINAIKSGCNLVLHCNANIKEMNKLAKVIPKIDNFTKKKTSDFYKFLI